MIFPEFLTPASDIAGPIDTLFIALTALCMAVAGGIYVLMIWFAFKYRSGSTADRSNAEAPHRGVEFTWTVVTLVLFLVVFFWASTVFTKVNTPPDDALEVFVVGKQWMWKLEHPSGEREINELHVPRGRPVRLLMTSQDVIHSFFVPAFRVKQDVVPGTYTPLSFTPTKSGEYALFCAEYCGTDHSRMRGRVVVMEPPAYERWLQRGDAETSMAARGAKLFRQYGCSGCHNANATIHAPMLGGLYGKPVQLQDGGSVIADERYLHDSIVLPSKAIVAGYPPIMPSFAGQIGEQEILQIIAYLKSTAE